MKTIDSLLLALALAAPPLAQAQAQNCTSPNTDGEYILDGASAMHWPTGLVWKRCIEGETFSGGQCSTNGALLYGWNAWAEGMGLLPQSFAGQDAWGIGAGFSQDLLESGGWRMAYGKELLSIIEGCTGSPAVNHTAFPDMPAAQPSSHVWSGSPVAGYPTLAGYVDFDTGQAYGLNRSFGRHTLLVRGGRPFAALPAPAAQAAAAGVQAAFPAFTLAAGAATGQAWGGARISGGGSPEFQVNGIGGWVQQAIVHSGDQITVRLTAPATGSHTATFTLRSGETTGTRDTAAGDEATALRETTASFTLNGPVSGACGGGAGPCGTAVPAVGGWGLLLLSLLPALAARPCLRRARPRA